MHRLRHISLFLLSLIAIAVGAGANAQKLNDKLLNRPYADLRRWHLGFSVGLHTQDLRFTHNGFVTEQGESWFIEQPAFSGDMLTQNIKSAYVVLPVDVKFAAQRFRNVRPYLVTGIMPTFDVTKRRSEYLKLKSTDFYLSVGFGCDFYLPYFKLNPEIKFCFGLSDVLQHKRPDLTDDPDKFKFTQSLTKVTSQMVVLTFYFE